MIDWKFAPIKKEECIKIQRRVISDFNNEIQKDIYKNPDFIQKLIRDHCMRKVSNGILSYDSFEAASFKLGYSISTLDDNKIIVRAAE